MSNEEARRILLSDADFSGTGKKAKLTADALCVAVDALEKQMPKPVVKKKPEDKHTGKCPVCGTPMRVLDTRDCKFCYHCGQAIDWDA